MVTIKSKKEIELMREAGRVTALTHKAIEEAIKPGMTTADIDKIAEETMKKNGAISAEKGYDPGIRGIPPYPASTCISVNDVVIHGIPSKKTIIKDGDIVSVDLVALKNGYNGDAARTFMVGNVSPEAKRLVEVTKQAFFEGIKYARKGNRIEEATSLHVHKFLAGSIGGDKQFMEMVERQDLDMVILFYNPVMMDPAEPDIMSIVKRCDQYNIPVATNIATAELLILGLARGDLDWRLNLK